MEKQKMNDSLGSYYASRRASAIINYNGSYREIGRVFAEYKDRLLVIDDENIREHVYLIPKTKVDHCSEKQMYFNIPENSLNEFEI